MKSLLSGSGSKYNNITHYLCSVRSKLTRLQMNRLKKPV